MLMDSSDDVKEEEVYQVSLEVTHVFRCYRKRDNNENGILSFRVPNLNQ